MSLPQSFFYKGYTCSWIRVARLALFCALVVPFFFFAGCAPKKKEKELTINLGNDPGNLHPLEVTLTTSMLVIRNACDGLTRIGPTGEPEPALAKSIECLDGGKRYRFHLREAYWSNGAPVVAQDFIRSWHKALKKEVPTPLVEQFYPIANATDVYAGNLSIEHLGVEVINDHELLITLEEINPHFLAMLAVPIFFPLPATHDHACPYYTSCGPFKIESWTKDSEIVLAKNPYYWDRDRVHLPKIHISLVADPQTQLELFELGQLDWCGTPTIPIPDEAIPYLQSRKRLRYIPDARTQILCFNARGGITQNVNIRRALSLALDRQELADHQIYPGFCAYSLIPPVLMHQQERNFFQEDLEEAKRLWQLGCEELGVDPKNPPKIIFNHVATDGYKKKAQAIQHQWRDRLGVDVSLETYENQVNKEKMLRGDFHIGHASWGADHPDPLSFLQLYYRPDSGRNYPGWTNSSFKLQVDLINRTADPEERNKIMDRAEAILIREMPITPISHPSLPYMVKERLKGYIIDPLGFLDFKSAYLEE